MLQPEPIGFQNSNYRTAKSEVAGIKPSSQSDALNRLSDLENLIPENLSPNKRAVIETMVALWEAKAKSKSYSRQAS